MELMQITEFLSAYRNSQENRNIIIAISGRARSGKSTLSKKISQELFDLGIPNVIYSWDWQFLQSSKIREEWIRSSYSWNLEEYLATVDQINWWDFDAIHDDLLSLQVWNNVVLNEFYDRTTGLIRKEEMVLQTVQNGIILFENTILWKKKLLSLFEKVVFINLSDKECLLNALNTDGERRNPINIAGRFLLTTFSENNFFWELFNGFKDRVIPVSQSGQISSFPNFHISTYVPVPTSQNIEIDSIALNGNKYLEMSSKFHGNENIKFSKSFFWKIQDLVLSLWKKDIDLAHYVFPGIKKIEKLLWDASGKTFYRINSKEWPFILMFISWNMGYWSWYSFLEVHEYLKKNNVIVPEIFAWDSKTSFICMEDLGDCRLLEVLLDPTDHDTEYRNVISQLVNLRINKYSGLEDYNFPTKKLTFEMLLWELDSFFRFFFEQHLWRDISENEKSEVYRNFRQIAQTISSYEQWIILKDVHSKNIMMKSDLPVFIDFQDAQVGPVDYDIASFLYDTYNPLSESDRKKYLEYYLEEVTKNWISIDRDATSKAISLIAVQRSLKGIGSFSWFETRKNNTKYLRYIWNFFQYAITNLAQFPEYANLVTILRKYYYL